jgi:TolB-like protein
MAYAILAFGCVATVLLVRSRSGGRPDFSSVAVLPLENLSADPGESDYLANGITESLTAKLTQVTGLRVTPWITSSRFAGSEEPLEGIAKKLNVEALIVGTFRRSGDSITGTVSIVDPKSGFQHWAREFGEPFSDLIDVQQKIALDSARNLKGKLSGEERREISKPVSHSVAAYEFYLKGASELQEGSEEGDDRALAYFQNAIEIDRNLAEAYVGIGAVFANRGGIENLASAQANYEQAIRIKSSLMAARRGLIRMSSRRGVPRVGLEQGRLVAQSGREDVEALLVRADAYMFCWDSDKAVPLYKRVMELDPENAAASYFVVHASLWAGHNEDVITFGENYLRRFDADVNLYLSLSAAAHHLGRLEEAERYYVLSDEVRRSMGAEPEGMGFASFYVDLGQPERFLAIEQAAARMWERRVADSPDEAEPRFRLAAALGHCGELDRMRDEERRLGLFDGDVPFGVDVSELVIIHLSYGDSTGARALIDAISDENIGSPIRTSDLAPWQMRRLKGSQVLADYNARAEKAERTRDELYALF